jgi:UDP-N-acetylglucosamine--N-acetylmuramyl-(pentapeptide) pyrophosphoryl-undecaprenol N-acetylglucosamine transferase
MADPFNILIACGGTGGHLFPGVAVAEEFDRRGHKVLLLISEKKVDAQGAEKYGRLAFHKVPAIAKPATFSPRMIPFLYRLWRTVRQCREILKRNECNAVLGMGGFTSLPPVLAGKKLGLMTYVHGSNAMPGKANRLTARWCRKILLGLEAAASYFSDSEVVVTGTPVRQELTELPNKVDARTAFGMDPHGPAVLVMGGSQGAQSLNTLVVDAAKAMPGLQFIHITGAYDFDRVKKLVGNREGYRVIEFCDDMATAYAACDVAVCRSGASSMTELAYVAMPSILVPYPHAADDHQTVNAEVFHSAGAAVLRPQDELDAGQLVADLTKIVEDDEYRKVMSANAASLAVRDAAAKICDVISADIISK